MDDIRRQLTVLRRELKSGVGKDRRREIQGLIESLETRSQTQSPGMQQTQAPVQQEDPKARERAREKRLEKERRHAQLQQTMRREAEEKIAAGPQLDVKEQEAFGKKLRDLGLLVVEIPSDGNCLFSAVSHQLSLYGRAIGCKEVRRVASDELRSHRERYESFVEYTQDTPDFDSYACALETTGMWGGSLELEALSRALGVRIEVLSAESDYSFGPPDQGQVLLLSYHRHQYSLGAHYNSLVKSSKPL